jgi:hypothetical protein
VVRAAVLLLPRADDGQPVSYRCLSALIHPGVEGLVRLRPDQIFMVDEFTVTAFRRRGITRRMAIAMASGLIAQGFHEVVGIHRSTATTRLPPPRPRAFPARA